MIFFVAFTQLTTAYSYLLSNFILIDSIKDGSLSCGADLQCVFHVRAFETIGIELTKL